METREETFFEMHFGFTEHDKFGYAKVCDNGRFDSYAQERDYEGYDVKKKYNTRPAGLLLDSKKNRSFINTSAGL